MLNPLMDYLDGNSVSYAIVFHSPAFQADKVAGLAHLSPGDLSKTVVVNIDGRLAMAVVPASCQVDLESLKQSCRATNVEIASEQEFRGRFPNCEIGAMPPFGKLYNMEVFVDHKVTRHKQMTFNAGTHRHLACMNWDDYNLLVEPKILHISKPRNTYRERLSTAILEVTHESDTQRYQS